jgi:hypothetical protein
MADCFSHVAFQMSTVLKLDELSPRQVIESWLPLLGARGDDEQLEHFGGLDGAALEDTTIEDLDKLFFYRKEQKDSIIRYLVGLV